MKASISSILLVCLISFFSCSKDDSQPSEIIKSNAKQITSFVFLQNGSTITADVIATIDEENKTITASMPIGTSVIGLTPEIELSQGATIDRTASQNFTEPVVYTVTAEDGSTTLYTATISNHVATYNLTSILSATMLDPSAAGTFDDVELFDDIDCFSTITLSSDNTFSLEPLRLNQVSNSALGVLISYEPIQCNIATTISGEFEINDSEILFDPFLLAQIFENKIEIIIQAELIVRRNGSSRKERIDLLLTYIKDSI